MKKTLVFVLILLSIFLFGCGANLAQQKKEFQSEINPQQTYTNDETAVKNVVKSFGDRLQLVSLQAPKDIVEKSIQENYGSLASPALLVKWKKDPENAPGRMVSSPWPDRIEILDIKKLSENVYEVKGEIIEITSVEKVKGGFAAKRTITLTIKNIGNRWLIDEVTLGSYAETNSVIYTNTQYGFRFFLPASWNDYSIVITKWEGLAPGSTQGEVPVETGPIISIRHPQWTSKIPRQDIPIMIFTISQWNSLEQGKFHIGAAPFGPGELGRNNRYVFALPARYNYAYPAGYEEVENILAGKPLQPINISQKTE